MSETLQERILAFPYWYHRIELPGELVTPGWAPTNPQHYGVPERLDGKRVLDVGAWDGYWSFEALKRGAREVVAIDDFSDQLGFLDTKARRAWETFDLCREVLGYGKDVCNNVEMDVYDVNEARMGRFDVVFFFGTLYHLRYPLFGLDRLSAVCDGDIYVESAILDDFSPYRGGLGNGYPDDQMVVELYPQQEYGNNPSNWWVPTLRCLTEMVRSAGFKNTTSWKLTDDPDELTKCRGFVVGSKP